MDRTEKMPWYDNYMLLLEGKRLAEIDIDDLENPEKQLRRVKMFYDNLGADYTKNSLLIQAEEDMSILTKGGDSRLSQLKQEVKIIIAIENAVCYQDDESIRSMLMYKDENRYRQLIQQLMFYIGVSRIKKDPLHKRTGSYKTSMEEAYDAILKKYPPNGNITLFNSEGVHYYLFYFDCLQECIKQSRNRREFEELCDKARERCYNSRLMLNKYTQDIYVADSIAIILSELANLEELINESL